MTPTLPFCTLRALRNGTWFGTLALCMLLAGCKHDAELLSNISEGEANEVVAALESARVPAFKQAAKDGLVNVMVDSSQVATSVMTLQAEGLPRERHAEMGQVFRKEGLISSPLEERARYLWALSQELGATVSQIDGVLKARVHLVLPERASGSTPAVPSSAAVFIKHQRGYNLQAVVPQVKQLVSKAIPGLSEDRVAVVLVAAQRRDLPGPDIAAPAVATRAQNAPSAAQSAATGAPSTRVLALAGSGLLGAVAVGGLAFAWRQRRGVVKVKPAVIALVAPQKGRAQ